MPNYLVNVSGVDAYDGKFTKRFVVNSIDYPTAISDAAAMITDLEALCAGAILSYTVATLVQEGETPAAGANRDEGLTFTMDLGNGKTATLKVPAPVKDAVQSDRTVDLTNGVVAAFLANWENGPFLISDGETAIGTVKGVLDK